MIKKLLSTSKWSNLKGKTVTSTKNKLIFSVKIIQLNSKTVSSMMNKLIFNVKMVKLKSLKQLLFKGGRPGLVVMGGDSCPKVMGSNPGTIYWMDMIFFSHWFVVKNCIVCLKRSKINEKVAGVCPFFKKTPLLTMQQPLPSFHAAIMIFSIKIPIWCRWFWHQRSAVRIPSVHSTLKIFYCYLDTKGNKENTSSENLSSSLCRKNMTIDAARALQIRNHHLRLSQTQTLSPSLNRTHLMPPIIWPPLLLSSLSLFASSSSSLCVRYHAVWPVESRQMSTKVAQKWFYYKK